MTDRTFRTRLSSLLVGCALAIPLALAALLPATSAQAATKEELKQGERIYREGILPSGERLRVNLHGEPAAPGLTFTCASCHLRSGLGAFDEGVYVPAINGDKLFKPLPRTYKGIVLNEGTEPPLRPAYTEATLIEALRHGKDPGGRQLSASMPQYQLEEKDLKLLVAYLKTLSVEFSPGISEDRIRLATVVSEDLPPAKRDALFTTLTFFFNLKNGQIKGFGNPRSGAKSRLMAENMLPSRELVTKSLSLGRWVLRGSPDTWRAQLEEYYRNDPVFALVGGAVNGSWQPIHQFCEQNGIPSLFPATDLPVLSESDWYTLYQSKGFYQEGESAAHFLAQKNLKEGALVEIVRESPQGKALSAGFRHAWQELGQKAPVTVPLPAGQKLDRDFLKQVLEKAGKGEGELRLLVWDDGSALPALELFKEKQHPEVMVFSARYLGESLWTLPEPVRGFSYLTYPYIFTPLPKPVMGRTLIPEDTKPNLRKAEVPVRSETQQVIAQTNVVTQLLSLLLMDLKGNYYRDNLLDVAGMMGDQPHPLFGRLNFGAGQRYASKGCYVVQLGPGTNPELVKLTGWTAQ
ncbi:cytochrome c [Geomonas silvestris]|uniref:Cytochrome c n=1 Tax=Geomonas silvestris TaxID=2740184 RepID=A0A6V8MPH0_9BACT|nr:ABC transporter substrate-binding protein [Geomonas silvestris]GFO61955.1 cytochrome c [Geomonas silvestris]